MSEPCECAVRDLAQIGNHPSKSEASIQKVTALNVGETENSLTDRLEAGQQREHKDMRYFWKREQVQCEDFSIKEKTCANVGTKPIIASLQQCCSNCELVFYKTMDPTVHYKMKADETCDGSGERLQPGRTQRPRYVHRQPRYVHRDPMQTRRHQHRNKSRNRQLPVLIVNTETDAQTE